MVVYKLFSKTGVDGKKGLFSVNQNMSFDRRRFEVEYIQNIINYPKVAGTRLYFFDSIGNAKRFLSDEGASVDNYEIWKCDVSDVRKEPTISAPSDAKQYWSKIAEGLKIVRIDGRTAYFDNGSCIEIKTVNGAMTGSHCKLLERVV